MQVADVFRHVANQLPPETRMTGFLGVVRWVMNRVQAYGNQRNGWSFDWARGTIDLIASYDTGTIAISNGATTVTGTDTVFTDAMVGRKIRIVGVDYVIDSRASNTEVELATEYGGTDETEAKFVVYKDEYPLSANISTVHRIWDKQNNNTIEGVSPLELGDRDFRSNQSGTVEVYAEVGVNSSGQTLVQFHPYPTAIARLEYWYQANITQISGIGSTIDIPEFYDELVKQGVYARQMQILRMNGWRDEMLNFSEMLLEAWDHDTVFRDTVVRMARADNIEPFRFLIRQARNVTVT